MKVTRLRDLLNKPFTKYLVFAKLTTTKQNTLKRSLKI